jgi:hypothetical protein
LHVCADHQFLFVYFDEPVNLFLFAFLFFYFIHSFYVLYFKIEKINGKRFLQIEISSPMVLGFGYEFRLNFGNVCKEWVEQYNVLKLFFLHLGFRNINIYYG